tara:strand:+ start:567 stop:839 length:273 start_codon:yes stop_codon:yes gene_type:complete
MKDYQKIHGHKRVKIGSIAWFFHNYEHGYQHCKGIPKKPYQIKHFSRNKVHGINKKQAQGHGYKKKTQKFEFTKKINKTWWDLSSGVKIK